MTNDRKTVAELMAELNSNPEHLVRKQAQEAARENLRNEMAKAEASLVAALRSAGVDVQSVWDLLNLKVLPAAAVPVLLQHVKNRQYPDEIREGMLRALASPEARSYWDELVGFFEHNSLFLPPERRYVAALALHGAGDDSVIEDVIRLASDNTLGLDRAPLLLTLQRSKNPKAKMLLLNLRDDSDLGKEVKRLRRLERKLS